MTSKQFYLSLMVFIVSLKVQKFPCLLYSFLHSNSYLLFVGFMAVEIGLVCLAVFIARTIKKADFFKNSKNKCFRFFVKFSLVFVAIYFLIQGTLFYEAIQDLFSHVLFDNLPWTLFSLLLIFCVFFLAFCGIKTIAYNIELYFFVIALSYVILTILAGIYTDFSVILPFQSIDIKAIVKTIVPFNIWFGDFFAVLFLALNTKEFKLGKTLLSYLVSMVAVVLMVIEFNGIFLNYTPMQPSLISVLAEQSMLGVDIGRVDWFLILFTQIGTILSAGLCLLLAKNSLSLAFEKVNSNVLLGLCMLIIYLVDVLVLVDTNIQEEVFLNFVGDFAIIIKAVLFTFILLVSLNIRHKNKNQKTQQKAINLLPSARKAKPSEDRKPSESYLSESKEKSQKEDSGQTNSTKLKRNRRQGEQQI